MYILQNQETNELTPIVSLDSISKRTGISVHTLRYNFNNQKKAEYIKKGFRIVKTDVIKRGK